LKSRIQTLSQVARRRNDSFTCSNEQDPEPDGVEEEQPLTPHEDGPERVHQDFNDPESEPAEMTGLKLELSTLSTSYASLQSTLVLIQTQLVDLKRVNQELQEENESYMILLREKTLSGQFDVVKQVGGASSVTSEDDGSDEDLPGCRGTDIDSMRSRTRSTLDIVEEEPFGGMDSEALGEASDSDLSHRNSRRRRTSSSHAHRGESLAGLPITGPGLDLAAELGRAENKDILAGTSIDDGDRHAPNSKVKRSKKDGHKIPQSDSTNLEDIEALRTEVKSLKDANKALSLYASKIIDRIIAQEGFEHVLAADYEKEPPTPLTAIPHAHNSKSLPQPSPKPRPQSTISVKPPEVKSPSPPSMARPTSKAQRRSLSFDWKSFSLFNTDKKPEFTPNLRPLTLKPGAIPVTTARKLDNIEDEEDRRERERLHATMKLMGLPTPTVHSPPIGPPMEKATSEPNPNAKNNRRFSVFNPKILMNESDASSLHSTSSSAPYDTSTAPPDLTQDALRFAEAEQSLAVLDARERDLSAEIAKGGSGGFTEITPRLGRRGRRSGGDSSGSTVWSAGMSGTAED
jgi:regulator of replication initiation timing